MRVVKMPGFERGVRIRIRSFVLGGGFLLSMLRITFASLRSVLGRD
jgi:hypothetical protein